MHRFLLRKPTWRCESAANIRIIPIGTDEPFGDDDDMGISHKNEICFDQDLIRRYDGRGPRYTSYPTALQFKETFTADDYRRHAEASNATGKPLSLYVHIPFCRTLCYYCACNKIVTRNAERVQKYMGHLDQEIAMQSALYDKARRDLASYGIRFKF